MHRALQLCADEAPQVKHGARDVHDEDALLAASHRSKEWFDILDVAVHKLQDVCFEEIAALQTYIDSHGQREDVFVEFSDMLAYSGTSSPESMSHSQGAGQQTLRD